MSSFYQKVCKSAMDSEKITKAFFEFIINNIIIFNIIKFTNTAPAKSPAATCILEYCRYIKYNKINLKFTKGEIL